MEAIGVDNVIVRVVLLPDGMFRSDALQREAFHLRKAQFQTD